MNSLLFDKLYVFMFGRFDCVLNEIMRGRLCSWRYKVLLTFAMQLVYGEVAGHIFNTETFLREITILVHLAMPIIFILTNEM